MNKIKQNQFIETQHHRMGGFPDVFQLRYGSSMLYFGFDCQEEYKQALELTEGKRYTVRFPQRYNPAQYDKLTDPMPLVTPTDLNYPYLPKLGYDLVTVKNAGTIMQAILNHSNGILKKQDWQLATLFMADVTKWLHHDEERTHVIYCNPDAMAWDMVEVNTCEDGNGLYLGILVKS